MNIGAHDYIVNYKESWLHARCLEGEGGRENNTVTWWGCMVVKESCQGELGEGNLVLCRHT